MKERLIKREASTFRINLRKFLGEIFSMMEKTEQLRLKINYLSHYNLHLPSAIYMMLDEGKLDTNDPINNFFHIFSIHRYDQEYDKYFSKFRDITEFKSMQA